MDDQDDLRTYLNDHLAGGTGAIEMIEHCRSANPGELLAQFLGELVAEIQADHQTLQSVMDRLDASQNRVKQVTARVGEMVSRIKLGSGDLGNLLTLETLSLGIEGKAAMWKSLKEVRHEHPGLASVDLDSLIGRAEKQREAVERWRLAAAAVALSHKATV